MFSDKKPLSYLAATGECLPVLNIFSNISLGISSEIIIRYHFPIIHQSLLPDWLSKFCLFLSTFIQDIQMKHYLEYDESFLSLPDFGFQCDENATTS